MPLTTAGRNFIAQAVINDSPTFFTNAAAHIGVGDSNSTFSAAHTDLQAATNKLRRPMEATYPQRTDNQLTFRSEFGTAHANYQWREWGVFNHSSTGVMLSRKAEDLGTKAEGSTWVLTVTITVNIGA
jgi:hypothetical protein